MTLTPDLPRLTRWLTELAKISSVPAPAVTRVLFSPEDTAARAWLGAQAAALGLAWRQDAVGNIFFRLEGTEPAAAPIATGSHLDAIPHAGAYDGTVGVLGGLEALAMLQRAGVSPRRPLEVIMFTAEEPTRFGLGCLGSRLMAGALPVETAEALRDTAGRTLAEWRAEVGWSGGLADVRLAAGHYAAFVELHIEQGPLLEQAGVPIGLVSAIAGPSSYRVIIEGEGGHAGAVLMPQRRDAGLAAAEFCLAIERAALTSGSPDTVATTGVVKLEPGAINSVPNRATVEIDLRDTRLATREAALVSIQTAAVEIAARRRVSFSWTTINADPPAPGDPATLAHAAAVCADLGLAQQTMVSRAYHDSLFMARICPTTMIFIPCRNGWSHRPEEYASPEAIAAGVTVLAHTLARLAA